jgi:hypothetical protein
MAVDDATRREVMRRRAEATGRRVIPAPDETPSRDEVEAAGAEAGTAVSDALADERGG